MSGFRLATLFKERLRRRFFSLWMLRNFLKALLNRSNISSNITKISCWMKCWISLTEKNSKKRKNSCWMKKNLIHSRVLPRRDFSTSESTISDSITGKECPSPSLIWHWMKEWMDLHVGWHVQTIQIFRLSSNIYPTCWIKCWIGVTRL